MCSNGIEDFSTVVVTWPREFALSISMNQSSPSLCVRLFELLFSLLGMRYRWRDDSWLGRPARSMPIVRPTDEAVLGFRPPPKPVVGPTDEAVLGL